MRNLDYNYHNDSRVRAGQRKSPFQNINETARTADIILEELDDGARTGDEVTVQVRLKREICPTCDGDGKHVNPSIDAGGISSEDFDEDPDFREEYMSGRYDVECYECRGLRVVWELDEDATDKAIVERFHEAQREEADYEATCRAERMMGA